MYTRNMPDHIEKLLTVLKQCQEQNMLVGFCDEDDKNTFEVGFVESFDKDCLTIKRIDANGMPDGIWFGEVAAISRFKYDTTYMRGVRALYENRNKAFEDIRPLPRYNPKADSADLDYLNQAKDLDRIVTIVDFDENELSGQVANVGKDYVELRIIESKSGGIDGFYVVAAADIHHIICGGQDELKLEFLYRTRYDLPELK